MYAVFALPGHSDATRLATLTMLLTVTKVYQENYSVLLFFYR